MADVVVVIPNYKRTLSADDRVAVSSFTSRLHAYPRVFMSPRGLDTSEVESLAPQASVERFDPCHFASWSSYNEFCKAVEFYERFAGFEYMLVAQLDAYVFRDELEFWCQQDFDYVGTPWFGRSRLWHWLVSYAGGGGFSLRRVSAMIDAAKRMWKFRTVVSSIHEDVLWASKLAWVCCPSLRRQATQRMAVQFGFDAIPEKCLAMNGGRLPFGCHGWTWPNRRAFWSQFIPEADGENTDSGCVR